MSHPRTITVQGGGAAVAVPDAISLSLEVVIEHAGAASAFDAAAERAGNVIAAVVAIFPGATLATTGITLAARTTWRNEQNVVIGYDAATTIEATNLPIDSVSTVLAAAVPAGGDALRIHAMRAEVTDPRSALQEARAAAFADAQAKAGELASLAGAHLGSALSIRESTPHDNVPLQRGAVRAMAANALPVLAGERSLSVHVEIVWELKISRGHHGVED